MWWRCRGQRQGTSQPYCERHRGTFKQVYDGGAGRTQHHRSRESNTRIISAIDSSYTACTRVPMLDAQRPADDLRRAQNSCVLASEFVKASLHLWQHAVTLGVHIRTHASAKSGHWRRHDKTTTDRNEHEPTLKRVEFHTQPLLRETHAQNPSTTSM